MTILGIEPGSFGAWLERLRPSVVRGYGGFWAADMVCSERLADVPVVVSVHDTNPELIHRSLRLADLVVCMSSAVADGVQRVGVDASQIRRLPNRVDPSIFHRITGEAVAAHRGKFPWAKQLLHVGRKVEQKNIEAVLHALAVLPPDYGCVFVGGGDAEPYKSLAKALGVLNRTSWVDSVENEELPVWYSAADCMCTPSAWEGFGVVFIEAAACGAAIVTSDIAPMNEYLRDGESAALVKNFRSGEVIASAVQRIVDDVDYRSTLQNGALAVSRHFHKASVDAAEVAIYEEAIALPPASGGQMLRASLLAASLRGADIYRNSFIRRAGSALKRSVLRS